LSHSLLHLVHLLGNADVTEVTRLLKTLRAVTRVSPEGYQRVAHCGCSPSVLMLLTRELQ
jgi:hypothetical protein